DRNIVYVGSPFFFGTRWLKSVSSGGVWTSLLDASGNGVSGALAIDPFVRGGWVALDGALSPEIGIHWPGGRVQQATGFAPNVSSIYSFVVVPDGRSTGVLSWSSDPLDSTQLADVDLFSFGDARQGVSPLAFTATGLGAANVVFDRSDG